MQGSFLRRNMRSTRKSSETLYLLIILSLYLWETIAIFFHKAVSSASEEEELINDNMYSTSQVLLLLFWRKALSLSNVCGPFWDISTLIQQPDKYIQRSEGDLTPHWSACLHKKEVVNWRRSPSRKCLSREDKSHSENSQAANYSQMKQSESTLGFPNDLTSLNHTLK